MLAHELVDLVDLINGYNNIQVEINQRFYVGVARLPADHAEAHSVLLEQGEYFLQEIGLVQSDGLPEGECFHAAEVLGWLNVWWRVRGSATASPTSRRTQSRTLSLLSSR